MRTKRLTAFHLKLIAIIGMTLDHLAWGIGEFLPYPVLIPLYFFGGLTFPIMGYLLLEGYHKTSNLKRYALRLFVFGVTTQPFYVLALKSNIANIMFSLLLCLLNIYLYDHMKNRRTYYLVLCLIIVVSVVFDWSLIGVLLVFGYHVIKDEKKRIIIPIITMSCSLIVLMAFMKSYLDVCFFIGSLLVIPLLLNYNGERGKNAKYLFYAYYPVHLAVIAGIYYLMR